MEQGNVPFAFIYFTYGFEFFKILQDFGLADAGARRERLHAPAFGRRPFLVSALLSFLGFVL